MSMKYKSLQIPICAIALFDHQDVQRVGVYFKNNSVVFADAESIGIIASEPLRERKRIGLGGVEHDFLRNALLSGCRKLLKLLLGNLSVFYAHRLHFYTEFSIHFFGRNAFARACSRKIASDDINLGRIFHVRARRDIEERCKGNPLFLGFLLRRGLEFLVRVEYDLRVHMRAVYTGYIRRQLMQARRQSSPNSGRIIRLGGLLHAS